MSGNVDFKPAFQAEKVTGNFYRMVTHIIEDVREVGPLKDKKIIARRLEQVREEFTEGYMIYFPQKHSIFVAADDEDQLRRIGVLQPAVMIDMNSGDPVPENFRLTNKELVEQSTRNRPRPQSGGLATLEGDIE